MKFRVFYMVTTRLEYSLQVIGIAGLYALVGEVSILLAIPPGYSAAIWPPAGIALVAMLIYGYRIWPGVFLGSFLINIWIGFEETAILNSIFLPIMIALGAVLQALVGKYILQKFANFPNSLSNEKQVFSFFFFGGALASLVNSIWSCTALFAFGKISLSNFMVNFATWWTGDTIGVFVFAPILLVWGMAPSETWAHRRMSVSIPIISAFVITIIVVIFGAAWERKLLKFQFNQQVASLAPTLEKNLKNYINVLEFMKGFYASSNEINRHTFKSFAERPLYLMPGLQALSWNPLIHNMDRAMFEKNTQNEGYPDFSITERNKDKKLIHAANRDHYVAVHYIEPFTKNKNAFGFDVASNLARKVALEKARDTGKAVATARITLVQETGKQFGMLVFMPVYENGETFKTIDLRREKLKGYMVGVFRGGDIINAAFKGINLDGVIYQLYDDSAPDDKKFLHENKPSDERVYNFEEVGLFGGKDDIGQSYAFSFGERMWRFEVAPTFKYMELHRQQNMWFVLLGGMIFTGLIGAFVLVLSGRNEALKGLVNEKTKSLQLSEYRLAEAQRIALLGNWEWEIQTNVIWWSDELHHIFDMKMDTPHGSFRHFHDFVHENDQLKLKEILDNAIETHEPYSIDYRVMLANGEEKIIHEQAEMVLDHKNAPLRLVGTVQDVTERTKLDKMKSEFISTASHELRTPLTSIKGALGLIEGGVIGGLSDDLKDMINVANRNTARLIDLVNDILDVDKLESDKMEIASDKVDMVDLIYEAVNSNQGFATLNNVEFSVTINDDNVWVKGDRNRLIQVMTNLLSNAAKFSPKGASVDIICGCLNETVRVSVKDYGSGIPQEFRQHVFDKFAQAASSSTRENGGTGLGLNISKSLIEIHGGIIDFKTEMNVGTTFYFDLPLFQETTE